MHLGFDRPGSALKPHGLRSNFLEIRKARRATGAISAEGCFAAVIIEEQPAKVGFPGFLNEDQAVGADGEMMAADMGHEGGHGLRLDDPIAVVDHDEVITRAGELHKRDFLHGATLKMRGSSRP